MAEKEIGDILTVKQWNIVNHMQEKNHYIDCHLVECCDLKNGIKGIDRLIKNMRDVRAELKSNEDFLEVIKKQLAKEVEDEK